MFLLLLLCSPPALGLENGLARLPPMGWLAWERFRCNTDCEEDPENCISERLYKSMADHLVVGGWRDLGYNFLMMDDCWMDTKRTADGQLVGDPDRFPGGVAALADYVHKLGLKFGIYEDYGTETCGGYPGSLGFLERDAKTFADWGVDYVKMDGCNSDPHTMDAGFAQFGAALRATGRDMVYQCEWPLYQGGAGIKTNYTAVKEHCNLWRNFYDVQDNWHNIQGIIDHYGDNTDGFLEYSGPGGWNDPDMLVIGNFGLSYDQSAAQLALWTVFAAPLLISVDLRTIRPEFKELLQHPGVLKVSQDPLGMAGRRVARTEHMDFFVRPVHPVYRGRTSYAVVVLNRWDMAGMPLRVTLSPAYLGLRDGAGYRVQDIYQRMELGTATPGQNITLQVNPMGVRFLRFDILPASQNFGREEEGEVMDEAEVSDWAYCSVTNPGQSGWRRK